MYCAGFTCAVFRRKHKSNLQTKLLLSRKLCLLPFTVDDFRTNSMTSAAFTVVLELSGAFFIHFCVVKIENIFRNEGMHMLYLFCPQSYWQTRWLSGQQWLNLCHLLLCVWVFLQAMLFCPEGQPWANISYGSIKSVVSTLCVAVCMVVVFMVTECQLPFYVWT